MPRLKLKTTREKGLLSALTETEIKDRTTSNKRKEIELALARPSSIWVKPTTEERSKSGEVGKENVLYPNQIGRSSLLRNQKQEKKQNENDPILNHPTFYS